MTHGGGQFLTVVEAAAFLGISRAGLYRLIDRGDLVKVRMGGRAHVLRASVYGLMGRAVEDATPPGGLDLAALLAARDAGLWRIGTIADLEGPEAPQEPQPGPAGPEGPG